MADVNVSVVSNETPSSNPTHKKKSILGNINGYVFLAPALVFLLIFTVYPIINTVIIAFKENYNMITNNYTGFGFGNFIKIFENGDVFNFSNRLLNTLLYAFISVPVSTLLALFVSVWLTQIKWLQKAYQTIFFLPYLTNAIAIGAVFYAMFGIIGSGQYVTSYGLINNFLGFFGIDPINFVNGGSNIWWNRFVVILYEVWAGMPFKILIIFSALQSVNKQYYDAAKIDGASKSKTLWKVTVPLISPMLSYLIITGFIGGFKEYTAVVGIFGDSMGPTNHEADTIVGFIYEAIRANNIGMASAGALILFGIIFVFTMINFAVSKKRVHY